MNWLFANILDDNATLLVDKKMNHFNIINSYPPDVLARFNNLIQKKQSAVAWGYRSPLLRIPATEVRKSRSSNLLLLLVNGLFLRFGRYPRHHLGAQIWRNCRRRLQSDRYSLGPSPYGRFGHQLRWGRSTRNLREDAELVAKMTMPMSKAFKEIPLARKVLFA